MEEYILKSEKGRFNRYRDVKLGRSPGGGTPTASIFQFKLHSNSRAPSPSRAGTPVEEKIAEEFLLPKDYVPPSGLRRLLLYRIGEWSLYLIILAFVSAICVNKTFCLSFLDLLQGQIIAANPYQVTLLNSKVGEPAEKLYIVATIYLVSSIIWWTFF
jgi:alpha-1,3-glucan synthase